MKDHLKSSITVVVISLCTLVVIAGLGIGALVLSGRLVIETEPVPHRWSMIDDDIQYYPVGPEFKLQPKPDVKRSFRSEQAAVEEADEEK